MARDGVWKSLDAALTWHPEDVNEVATGSSTMHSDPVQVPRYCLPCGRRTGEAGRSALDAVELDEHRRAVSAET